MQDAQGHALSGATRDAVAPLDEAVRAFTLVYGDTMGFYDLALAAAPRLVMAHLGKAWPLSLANDPGLAAKARLHIEVARALPMNARETAHLAALEAATKGQRQAAVAILDRHLMSHPFDLVAHMAAHQMDGHLGRFHLTRDRIRRALPLWSPSMPGYGILISFYAFGLEEAGDYALAEDTGRRAAELEPHGYWPHHCVSHVLEMTGRPADGLTWMAERQPFWSEKRNVNRVHIWWHKALFHMELGEHQAALDLYDGPIRTETRPAAMSICNPSALLWRLDALGLETGDRWQQLARQWAGHADGRFGAFPDIHAAMAEIGAGDWAALERRLAAMRETARETGEHAPLYGEIAVPIVEGLADFKRGAHARAVERLLAVRAELWRMGGSFAQRDVVDWTLTEAAIRGGLKDVAVALANERLGARPGSKPNHGFSERARAIA